MGDPARHSPVPRYSGKAGRNEVGLNPFIDFGRISGDETIQPYFLKLIRSQAITRGGGSKRALKSGLLSSGCLSAENPNI